MIRALQLNKVLQGFLSSRMLRADLQVSQQQLMSIGRLKYSHRLQYLYLNF